MRNEALREKSLPDMFREASLDESVLELFENVRILSINVYKKTGKIEMLVSSERLIPAQTIDEIECYLISKFNLRSFSIKVKYELSLSIENILPEYWDSITYIVNREIALSKGILPGSTWELDKNRLSVKLKNVGGEILKVQGCDTLIERLMHEQFGIRIKVCFIDPLIDAAVKEQYLEFKEKEEFRAEKAIEQMEESRNNGKNGGKSRKQESGRNEQSVNIIIGKNFSDSIMEMREVTPDSGKVAVEGEIFSVEFREIRGGRHLCMFDMTDHTSSLTIKAFIHKDDIDVIKEQIREGICVKARGEAQYDKFSREMVVMASDVVEVEKPVRCDTAERKRVELHMHTQMSSMDATTPVKELVRRAAGWGHSAVAVTDHGVVQAYPDAYEAGRKNNIKIIYGMECYLVDNGPPIVRMPDGHPVLGEFVVLDLETTGLHPERDKITEIGAVKIKEGNITGKFSSFVNPLIPIPDNIVKLTGITDEMVRDAPPIEAVLPGLLEFIGDLPVIAHNASFDMGFIYHNAQMIGKSVPNSVIDTLQLSRCMFPRLQRHRLDSVAKHLGIKQESHHRAVDDCRTAALIYSRCIEMLGDKGIKTINDLQEYFDSIIDFKNAPAYHSVILVKNHTGLRNLYRMVSESHIKFFYKKPRVPRSLIERYREGLLLGSACEAGELYIAILNGKNSEEIIKTAQFYDYLEIQPLGNNQFLVNSRKVESQEGLRDINRKIVELGERLGKPVVATCDVHFMDPEDEVFRRILMAGQGYEDADRQAPLYLRTTDEMLDEFSYLGEKKAYEVVVENTNLIAGMIETIAPVPEGTFPPKMEGAAEEIERLAQTKAREIYGDPLPEIVECRLRKELDSIIKNGFAVMYLIAQKLVSKSLEDGYLVGSRGSVGSSFVANMAGITEVNSLQPHYICTNCKYTEFILDGSVDCGFDLPDKNCPNCGQALKKDGYDIPFETFLGFEGDKEPDIDLNFSGEYQPRAHRYTEELFGEGHVFRAGTIATVAEKTAYGFIKNYLDERNIVVTNAEINRLVKGCTGIKRTTGQHPGGIMIVPQDKEIFDFSPIQRPADDIESNVTTTHFDYHFLHGSILKLDILGHDDPTVIKMLEDLTGVDARTIPIGEKRTIGIFSGTEPLGVSPEDIGSEVGTLAIPEFGTKFVRQMLIETKPTTFSELIRISGLSHGTDVWLNNARDIIKNGIAPLSRCICCRDDIMIYLIHAGLPPKTAFKIMEDVRKGRGINEEYEEVMKQNKVPDWYIQSCKTIKYMFPKAHAAAYVMMAFRIAWFKVYYPEAFYVTYFTVRADEFDADLMTHGQDRIKDKIRELEEKGNEASQKEKNVLTILEVANEMYARGIKFLPVDLYKSDAVKFQITSEGIRPPLNALQGLGNAAAQNIAEARRDGKFLSIDELRTRAKVSRAVIEILQRHGCLDNMPESNQISLF